MTVCVPTGRQGGGLLTVCMLGGQWGVVTTCVCAGRGVTDFVCVGVGVGVCVCSIMC